MTMASACTQSLHITEGSCHKIGNHQHTFAPIKGSSSVIYNNNNINTITFTVIERFVKHRNKYLIKDNCKCRDTWELLYVSNFNDSIIFSKNEAYTITDALPTIENCAIKWHTENIFTYSIAAEHKDTLGNLGPNLNAIVYTFDNNYAVKELVFFNSFLQNSPGIYCLTMQDGTTINAYNSFGFSSDNSTRIEVVEGCD